MLAKVKLTYLKLLPTVLCKYMQIMALHDIAAKIS